MGNLLAGIAIIGVIAFVVWIIKEMYSLSIFTRAPNVDQDNGAHIPPELTSEDDTKNQD